MSLSSLWAGLKNKYKITIISTFIFGLLSQGMGIFNKYSYHDDINNIFGVGLSYQLGRWMLDILGRLETKIYGDGNYSLPVYIGFVSIALIALTACIIVKFLDIENETYCAFIGALMVSFPVVTSIFGFLYTLHFYMVALLMGVLAAYIFCKTDKWYMLLLGILLMAFSIGVYQAFIPTILTLVAIYLMGYVIDDTTDFKGAAIVALRAAVSSIVSLVFYWIMNLLFLRIYNSELSSHKGISQVGELGITDYLGRLVKAYELYIHPHINDYFVYPGRLRNIYHITIYMIAVIAIYMALKLFIRNKAKGIAFALLVLVFPLCSNFIFVMVYYDEVHALMEYSLLFPFVLLVWLLEKAGKDIIVNSKKINVIIGVCLLAIVMMFCRYDNTCFLKANYLQQAAISYFTTLVTQIKSVEGYNPEYPVAYVNKNGNSDPSVYRIEEFKHIEMIPYDDLPQYIHNYNWRHYVEIWCGYSPKTVDADPFAEMKEVQDMPSYPNDGSIKIIDDTIVVKF